MSIAICEHCHTPGASEVRTHKGVTRRFTNFGCGSEKFERLVASEWNETGTIRGSRCRKNCGEIDKPTEMPDMRGWKRR